LSYSEWKKAPKEIRIRLNASYWIMQRQTAVKGNDTMESLTC
jgi:hypothetical protein